MAERTDSTQSKHSSYSVDVVRQSPPVDFNVPFDVKWVNGKTILITGGATGFGSGMVRLWAANGATVVFGDVNIPASNALVKEIREQNPKANVHFVRCDVTDWQSQVSLFKEAVKLSPHGGIDTVVANAGVAFADPFQTPSGLDADEPPEPNFKILDINLYGVMYTAHLAYFYLPKNPGSPRHVDNKQQSNPAEQTRDRHLLFVGSIASLGSIAIQPQYGASKHGVLGLFRSLRSSSFVSGVRINIICPYFIDTPIVPAPARLLLAGGATGKPEDVIEAASRLVADTRIVGRALAIGPRVKTQHFDGNDNDFEFVAKDKDIKAGATVEEKAIWECYADDWDECEAFCRRFVRLLNAVEHARGWGGWAYDVWAAVWYGVKNRSTGIK